MVRVYTHKRSIVMARWALEHDATVREVGQHFNLSKSTVHHDLRVVLPQAHSELSREIACMLDRHKTERIQEANEVGRHIRNDS